MSKKIKNHFISRLRTIFICGSSSSSFDVEHTIHDDQYLKNQHNNSDHVLLKNVIYNTIAHSGGDDDVELGDIYIGWLQSSSSVSGQHHQALKQSKISFSLRRNAVSSIVLEQDLKCLQKLLQHKMLAMHGLF